MSSEDVRRTILEGLDEGGLDLSVGDRTFDYKEIKRELIHFNTAQEIISIWNYVIKHIRRYF